MCFLTGGLFTSKRMINLKKSQELSGYIILSPPWPYYFSILDRIIAVVLLFVAIGSDFKDVSDSPLTETNLTVITAWLYTVFAGIAIPITIMQILDKADDCAPCISICYYVSMPIIQCVVAASVYIVIQILDTEGGTDAFGFTLVAFIVVIAEALLNTLQFNYLLGTVYVIVYMVIMVISLEVKDSGEIAKQIILPIIYHLLITHFKNWINFKWFTSERISSKVNELGLLHRHSTKRKEEELMSLSINGETENDDKYVKIVMGSCVDQRKKTMAAYQALNREQANVVLLLGDNVYADLAPPTITKPYVKCCKIKRVFEEEYNRLLDHKDFRPKWYDYSNQVWMALWDDHDYGENDAAREYGEKLPSKKAFIDFIEKIQETNHISEIDEQLAAIKEDDARGVYYYHDYEQKLDSENVKLRIIMMDTRFDRAEDESDIVGDAQWEWLKSTLDGPDDIDWYLICNGSPLLNEGKWVGDGDDRHMKKTVGQPTRDKLFEILKANDGKLLNKTVLLSGDLHYSVWHSYKDQLYELTASSITHSKPWFCCKCWFKYIPINEYVMAKENDGNGATSKSEPCQKNGFGILKINKNKFNFCIKDAFGYSYINVSHVKK